MPEPTPSKFFFSWCRPTDGPLFNDDEEIFAIELNHVEGDFATLKIDIVNPRVGLLSAGRNVWCWLAYQPAGGAAIPVFHGRLIGVPQNLQDEVVRLEFIARPLDFAAQKAAVAATLQVLPFWDPVWLKDKVNDPDTVLESRPSLWHIDRVTLEVTTSDIINGEDGLIDVTADDHFYDAMTVSYGQTPLTSVAVTGTVTWDQTGGGTIDLTGPLVAAFQASGSPLPSPLICSLTGDGLLSAWPQPGSNIGGGWSIGVDSSAVKADWIRPAYHKVVYTAIDPFPTPTAGDGSTPTDPWVSPSVYEYPDPQQQFISVNAYIAWVFSGAGIKTWAVAFPVTALSVRMTADWNANRKRNETVQFTLTADLQPIITDPDGQDTAILNYSSDAIGQAIDPGGTKPQSSSALSSYFMTDRGQQSFEYLVLLARAKLLARARCVIVKFVCPWDFAISWLSCRVSVRLFDDRLPGGGCIGKVTGYVLSWSDQGISAEVTIACSVGRGGSVTATAGQPTYAAGGYIDPGSNYVAFINGTIDLVPGELTYLGFDNFTIADDGTNLLGMTADTALLPTAAASLSTTCNTQLGLTTVTALAATDGLESGGLYSIAGAGIQPGSEFTFNGRNGGSLSIGATATQWGVGVTISRPASNGILILNGINDQVNAVNAAAKQAPRPDPVAALKSAPTTVCLELLSLDGGSFNTTFPMVLSPLMVPMTIDLEGPSVSDLPPGGGVGPGAGTVTTQLTVIPSAPVIDSTTPVGAVIATVSVTRSDGLPWGGTIFFAAPNFDGGGRFALLGPHAADPSHEIIVNPVGPGLVNVTGSITDYITLDATP